MDHIFNAFLEELQRRQVNKQLMRNLRGTSNPFNTPHEVFRKMFRFPRDLAHDFYLQIQQFFDNGIQTTKLPAVTQAPKFLKVVLPSARNITQRNLSLSTSLLTPRVQQPAPNFSGTAVVDGDFKSIQLSDYKEKYVVLFFYPLDFTFVCPTELIALDDRIEDFKALNAEVIGCSIDSHFSHLGWMNTKRAEGGLGKLRYPLLSDIHKEIARDYDVLLEADGVALRGMFIIDPNGILRQITVNDLPIGRSVDEVLRIIEALRFVEEHGEVCPANWRKGEKTIKPDPKGSQDYFKSTHS